MTVPKTFRKSTEKPIQSYDFITILNGVGYGEFYLLTGLDNTETNERIITSEEIKSEETEITYTNTTTTDITEETKVEEDDWNLEIGINKKIKGKAFINLNWENEINAKFTNAVNMTSELRLKLKRDRGGIETTIGEGKSSEIYISAVGPFTIERNETLIFDCVETDLRKNDILRLTVEKWIITSTKEAGTFDYRNISYTTDPQNILKTATNYNKPSAEDELYQYANEKRFKINIPFQIDI